MTNGWPALPNSINIRGRGCDDLRACVLRFHRDSLQEMLKNKERLMDDWLGSLFFWDTDFVLDLYFYLIFFPTF